MKLIASSATLIIFLLLACSTDPKEIDGSSSSVLGELQHKLPVSDKAKLDFDKGLLLLHSFEYDDAREAFESAIEADPTEMMAYWGVAMSHYKALWGLQDLPAGRGVLSKIAQTKDQRIQQAEEGIERDLWQSIEILYGEGELTERNEAYTDHMSKLYRKYKDSQEIAAFYALGLMWSAAIDADDKVYKLSANVAQGILKENPNHPGAVHYIIHAYDNPELAHLAIDAANKYAQIAPDATHALHMPSHIYLDRGMWNEMVSSNEMSYQASVNRMERKGLDDKARGFHSFHWLHYGYLQQGRYEKAKELMTDMLTYTPSAQTPGARAYLIKMQNMHLIETGEWGLSQPPMTVKTADIGIVAQAQARFFESLSAFNRMDAQSIQAQIDSFVPEINSAELLVSDEGTPMCSAGQTRYAPNKVSIGNARTILNQMRAMEAILRGDQTAAENYFKVAVELENSTEFPVGPPSVPYPSFEQYGFWLLQEERFEEALDQFNNSLRRAPLRSKALHGKIKALTELGRKEDIKDIQSELDKFWKPNSVEI